MAEYTYPGVYIEEIPGGPGPISGVSTSNLGLIGFTTKGEVNKPILCTSFPEFVEKFGSFTEDGLSPTEAYAFFANGGQRLYFVRVTADDAVEAYADYTLNNDGKNNQEILTDTPIPSGVYNFQLDHMPCVPGTVTITFPANPRDNIFEDLAGDGVLVATGGTGIGGTGSINYETGEVSIALTDPGNFTTPGDVEARYGWIVFRFQMKWPGIAGDYYRVRIQPGSSDYLDDATASWSRFTVLIEYDVNMDTTNPSWTVMETFADMVLDDPASPNYITTVVNNDITGSDIIEVIDYGNEENPPSLQGVYVLGTGLDDTQQRADGSSTTVPEKYTGNFKGWKWVLDGTPVGVLELGCFPTTLALTLYFQEMGQYAAGSDDHGLVPPTQSDLTDSSKDWPVNGLVGMFIYNTGDGSRGLITANTATTITATLAGGTLNQWTDGDWYNLRAANHVGSGTGSPQEGIASPGTAANPVKITPGSVKIYLILVGLGLVVLEDDGAGNLWDGVAGSAGTIDYTTGQITSSGLGTPDDKINIVGVLAWAADTTIGGESFHLQCNYVEPVAVVDDGDGNLALSATQAEGYPSKFGLDPAGDNVIDYDTGDFSLYFQVAGNPTGGPGGGAVQATYYTQPDEEILEALENGSDGSSVSSSDIISPALAANQEGLYAFGQVDELMQLVASDFQTDVTVADALITYAELMKDKFIILTVPHGLDPQEAVNWKKFQLNKYTSYAALYYPHIKITDPVSEVAADIPCGGHVAGVYARTDTNKNVGKAPAGTQDGVLNWSIGLELDLTPTQVGVCNPEKINCLVQWPHTGRCVWGARSLDIAGGEWPYIQMRRLFMFLEKSVFRATHAHVFKNNGPSLWAAIQTQITNFLLGLQQAGYFAGSSPGESFFVICDRTNNPQNTVDQGIVFCDIGVAPNKPSEFIVFRFQQKALS